MSHWFLSPNVIPLSSCTSMRVWMYSRGILFLFPLSTKVVQFQSKRSVSQGRNFYFAFVFILKLGGGINLWVTEELIEISGDLFCIFRYTHQHRLRLSLVSPLKKTNKRAVHFVDDDGRWSPQVNLFDSFSLFFLPSSHSSCFQLEQWPSRCVFDEISWWVGLRCDQRGVSRPIEGQQLFSFPVENGSRK